jgi:hypothetical protein
MSILIAREQSRPLERQLPDQVAVSVAGAVPVIRV